MGASQDDSQSFLRSSGRTQPKMDILRLGQILKEHGKARNEGQPGKDEYE